MVYILWDQLLWISVTHTCTPHEAELCWGKWLWYFKSLKYSTMCIQMFWNEAKMKAEGCSNNADNYNATQCSIQLFQWQAPLATWLDCDSHAIHRSGGLSVAVCTVAVMYMTITDGLPTLLYTTLMSAAFPQYSMHVSLVRAMPCDNLWKWWPAALHLFQPNTNY